MPSHSEPFGLAAPEAIALGVPVRSSRSGLAHFLQEEAPGQASRVIVRTSSNPEVLITTHGPGVRIGGRATVVSLVFAPPLASLTLRRPPTTARTNAGPTLRPIVLLARRLFCGRTLAGMDGVATLGAILCSTHAIINPRETESSIVRLMLEWDVLGVVILAKSHIRPKSPCPRPAREWRRVACRRPLRSLCCPR